MWFSCTTIALQYIITTMSKPKKIEELTEAFPITGRRVSIVVSHPDIACFWYYKKNCGFGPEDFSYGSETKVWWFCNVAKDHVFQKSIKMRVRAATKKTNGCPFCRGIRLSRTNWLAAYPGLVKEFHPTKNGKLTPETVVAFSTQPIYWKCSDCGNVYKTKVYSRAYNGTGCRRCNFGERMDLRKYPQAMKMFDKERNKKVDPKSMDCRAKVWWKCPKADDHRFKSGFYKSHGPKPGCPHCLGQLPSSTNNLELIPRLAKEFHPTKNGKLKPTDLTRGCLRKVWWKCPKGPDHEWQQYVFMRKRGRNCPYCSGFKLSSTNVLSAYPKIAKEFHPTKNGKLKPDEILATSIKKVFWRCSTCQLEWQVRPYERIVEGLGWHECKKVNTGRGRMSTGQKAKAAKLLESGMPVAKIADEIGVHFMTIYRLRDAIAEVGKKFKTSKRRVIGEQEG